MVRIIWTVTLAGCVGTVAAGVPLAAPKVPAPKRVAVATRVIAAAGLDSLVTTVTWTLPANDGKGPLDSITVNVVQLTGGTIHARLAATAVALDIRQPIPLQDATWQVSAQVCTWRGRGASASSCVVASASPFIYVLAPPPPVTGVGVVNAKSPP